MRRITRSLICGILLVGLNAIPATASNKATQLEFTGFVTAISPCNGEFVSGPVTTKITYHETVNANGTHVMVHVISHGNLAGGFGNDYQISLAANAQFNTIQGTYSFDHNAIEWIGLGNTPGFTFDHTIQNIHVFHGRPVGHNFIFISNPVCKQPG